ncbi:DUF547 domain-containing protein [Chondrinema litorale]|uniref:DUF547 domain-containing protein n=1 Tax=Chondrinema litorale TaxID=2994555 RepID=UPI002543ED71|nr:DUF547 domain-containing protein [Chondrinema litorale]UZR93956.1 DUF547 domain-containing protein [Chondrinema litorale]
MSIKVLLLLIAFFTTVNLSAQKLEKFFIDADVFFKKWVVEGNINYSKLKSHYDEIENLHIQISNANLSDATDEEKKAFYINTYNILVIQQITKHYPIKSALDKSGFFDKFNHKIAGEMMSLDRLEKKNLILKYKDPRVHFALGCAAISCPKLANYAYTPQSIEHQLTNNTRTSLNDSNIIYTDKAQRKLTISKIFDWYHSDFGNTNKGVLNFINQYRDKKIPENYLLEFKEYNWKLNLTSN